MNWTSPDFEAATRVAGSAMIRQLIALMNGAPWCLNIDGAQL